MNGSPTLTIIIFIITYSGVAIGRFPGLALDRTGIALLGAIAMIVSGIVSLEKAVTAVDLPTIILLYALMAISAQLRIGGFYTWTALSITRMMCRPRAFLFIVMVVSAVLSAVLANDIVCLAFTPVLTVSIINAGLNPTPFLLGLAISSNIGSAATIIGNPQNMLIGQVGGLNFAKFLYWCFPPAIVSLVGSYFLICFLCGQMELASGQKLKSEDQGWPKFNPWQSFKGMLAVSVLIVLFFTSIPRELSAIAVAGVILCSRKMKSRHVLGFIDWHLITLFCALFVIIYGIETANVPSFIIEMLEKKGIDLNNLVVLTVVSTLLSNLVSNVPATMLLTQFLDPANPVQWYVLAVSSTFAGNLIVIGSIANLIVIEQAENLGVQLTFKEHARTGIPVTIFSLLVLVLWMSVV